MSEHQHDENCRESCNRKIKEMLIGHAKSNWEIVDHDGGDGETKRLRVHNGWLIVNRWKAPDGLWLQSIHYFKDEKGEWKI